MAPPTPPTSGGQLGCRVLPILKAGKKSLNFPPDHSHIWYFLIYKNSKSLNQQGFYHYSASPNYTCP
ncbi:unknown protein [Microcystis aeruginosa NIES-843]|uniref:Uncharacterized protein n=1 Tax=Microcystis aeruginosa (strain NIES-843 / IAM M-2473) TaxID=449447 RepID=B0JKI2_MICAN|nr:unknown protein [Microcystis aeruginosa NIES-843]